MKHAPHWNANMRRCGRPTSKRGAQSDCWAIAQMAPTHAGKLESGWKPSVSGAQNRLTTMSKAVVRARGVPTSDVGADSITAASTASSSLGMTCAIMMRAWGGVDEIRASAGVFSKGIHVS